MDGLSFSIDRGILKLLQQAVKAEARRRKCSASTVMNEILESMREKLEKMKNPPEEVSYDI